MALRNKFVDIALQCQESFNEFLTRRNVTLNLIYIKTQTHSARKACEADVKSEKIINFAGKMCSIWRRSVSQDLTLSQYALMVLEMTNDRFSNFEVSDDYRRDELVRLIEHSVERLNLSELEALYYDMLTKDYIKS